MTTRKQILFGLLSLLCLGAAATFVFGRSAYRHYRERQAARRAEVYLNKAEVRNAALCARQALGYNPSNTIACTVMARMAETVGAPAAIEWRRRVAGVSPTVDNRLQLAAAALRLEPAPWTLASQTLAGLSLDATNRTWFHTLAAELALKLNHTAEAEEHFTHASLLEPQNPWHRLNVSALRIRSTNGVAVGQARLELERLSLDPKTAPAALRWLIEDALKRQAPAEAQAYSARLVASPAASLEDDLRHLGLLRHADATAFQAFLNRTEARAGTNALAAHALAAWMRENQLANEAHVWLTNLPDRMQSQDPIRLAIADCVAHGDNWPALERHLQSAKWGASEFLRLALLSRAEGKQGLPAADAHWRLALHEAGERVPSLIALCHLAREWGRAREYEELLWIITRKAPRESWAWVELDRVCTQAGDTLGLHRLYSTLAGLSGIELAAKNNLAATSLLLQTNLQSAHDLADYVYREDSLNPIFASTCAYSLHLRHRTTEGLALLEKLKPEQRQAPPVVLYYSLLLCADGQQRKAAALLGEEKSSSWLPEEKRLWREIKARVEQ